MVCCGELVSWVERELQLATSYCSTAKLVDVAFGIKKLQISCVVEDEKVGVDFLEESITAFADHVSIFSRVWCPLPYTHYNSQVQSVDVAAFNKI